MRIWLFVGVFVCVCRSYWLLLYTSLRLVAAKRSKRSRDSFPKTFSACENIGVKLVGRSDACSGVISRLSLLQIGSSNCEGRSRTMMVFIEASGTTTTSAVFFTHHLTLDWPWADPGLTLDWPWADPVLTCLFTRLGFYGAVELFHFRNSLRCTQYRYSSLDGLGR